MSPRPQDPPAPLDSRVEYERRIHRVMDHIERHLDQPLDLETLAAVAHFSAFHFHRLFRAWTGETLGDHLRRRRVEKGALRLRTQPGSSVLEVALAVGFGSGEAFARAFKSRFGATPSAWREERNPDQAEGNLDQAERSLDQARGGPDFDHGFPATPEIEDTTMNTDVTLIDLPPTPIAYFRHTGPYGPPVARFWMERWRRGWPRTTCSAASATASPTTTRPSPSPRSAATTPASRSKPEEVLSGQPLRTVLPGGRYACTRFEGTVGRHRRRLAAPDRRLAADERPAARCPAAARALPGRREVRSEDRRVRLQAVHPGGAAVSRAGLAPR